MNAQAPHRPAKPYRRPKKDPVRILAFEALRAVDERDAYANLVLPPLLKKARENSGFEPRDAALATELVYGTLRRQGTYDAIISACVDRPLREVDPPVLDVLALGAHQLLGTRIPTHAAVSASVELARVVLGDGRARFVNAVLRKIAQDDLDTWLERVAPPYDEDAEDHLAVVHSHPRWVVSALWDALGGGRAGIEDLLEADNERPEVTLVARPGRASTEELLTALGEDGALPGRWSPYAVRLSEGGEPGALDAVREGRAGVQDEGSQLVAVAVANAPLEGPDARWLDGCAGPGGKAALMAALAAERGATLVAAEKQPHRARLVDARSPGTPARTRSSPRTAPARPGSPAPSTGSWSMSPARASARCGAGRRRAGAVVRRTWRASRRSSADCCGSLRRRTGRRSRRVRDLLPASAETKAVVEDVLRGRGGPAVRAEWIDARALMPGVPALGDGPDVQLWPHLHGTDAMYLALLRRTA